jgi:hypothetical protein
MINFAMMSTWLFTNDGVLRSWWIVPSIPVIYFLCIANTCLWIIIFTSGYTGACPNIARNDPVMFWLGGIGIGLVGMIPWAVGILFIMGIINLAYMIVHLEKGNESEYIKLKDDHSCSPKSLSDLRSDVEIDMTV